MGVEHPPMVVSVVAVLVGVVEVEVLVDVDDVLVEVDVVKVPVVPVVRVVPVVPVVLVVVGVVPRSGVLFGDAWAWAGTTIDSTTGFIHLDGRMMVTVGPPTGREIGDEERFRAALIADLLVLAGKVDTRDHHPLPEAHRITSNSRSNT
jgi:hypothetical protein